MQFSESWVFIMFVAGLAVLPGQTPAPTTRPSDAPILYVCEKTGPGFRDVVTLDSNEKLVGKALEWATDLLIFDAAGNARRSAADHVRSVEMRRDPALAAKPTLADLTTAYVEHRSGAGPVVHVLNAGSAPSKAFDYRIVVDGKPIGSGRVEQPIEGGALRSFEVPSAVPSDGRVLQVDLDTKNENVEIARWNNTFVEPVEGVPVQIFVSKDRYAGFRASRSLVDTFCFEDWIQYHVRMLNDLFARSSYPGSPEGIRLRVRVASIVVKDELSNSADVRAALAKEIKPGTLTLLLPRLAPNSPAADAASLVDWSLMQRVGLELGLVDLSKLNAPVGQCLVRDGLGDFVQREFQIPGSVTMMQHPGPRLFSELDAAFLNRETGQVAGGYLQSLPEQCGLQILDNSGRPLPACEVAVFQRADSGREGWTIGEQPIYIGETDPKGRFDLKGRRGGAFGEIAPDGSNGILLVRVARSNAEEYHFVSILDFLLARTRGYDKSYDAAIHTQLGAVPMPEAPRYTRVKYDMEDPNYSKGFALFPASKSADLLEYRLFAQPSRSSDWMLFANVPPEKAGPAVIASIAIPLVPIQPATFESSPRGTTFGYALANKQGIQGPLSSPRYVPVGVAESQSLAVFPDAKSPTVIISEAGPLQNGLIRSNINSFHDDFGIRTNAFPQYEPWGGGLAFDQKKRLVMTDPHNHQVGWYEQGKLVQLAGGNSRNPQAASKKIGLFDTPLDVAVNDKGRIYIADTKNNRIQELDDRGNFVRMFHEKDEKDDDDVFTRPKALGFSFGKLCVTDLDGERVQVFDVSGANPKRGRVLREVREADRALVGKSGRIYVPAKDEKGNDAMLIYPIQPNLVRGVEQSERTVPEVAQGKLRGPRGFYPCKYPDGTQFGFYVTAFPFVVQRFMLE